MIFSDLTKNGIRLDEYFVDAEFNDFRWIVIKELSKLTQENIPKTIYWNYSDQQLLPAEISLRDFISNPNQYPILRNMCSLAGIESITEEFNTGTEQKGRTQLRQFTSSDC